MLVDGAEHRGWVVGVEEGAGAVVDGLAGEGHVVGVHDTVDEADQHPPREQGGLAFDHGGEQREGSLVGGGLGEVGVVTAKGVVGEGAEGGAVIAVGDGGGPFEGAHADVAGGDAGEHGAGQGAGLAPHLLAGGDDGEAAGGGDAEGVHGFAHEVFAQHGPERGATVAPT